MCTGATHFKTGQKSSLFSFWSCALVALLTAIVSPSSLTSGEIYLHFFENVTTIMATVVLMIAVVMVKTKGGVSERGSISWGEEEVHAGIPGSRRRAGGRGGWMQGSHPLVCPLFMLLYGSLHVSGTRLLLAGCGCHKCQACTERCNLSSRHGRPVEPTVLLHTAGESRTQHADLIMTLKPTPKQHR